MPQQPANNGTTETPASEAPAKLLRMEMAAVTTIRTLAEQLGVRMAAIIDEVSDCGKFDEPWFAAIRPLGSGTILPRPVITEILRRHGWYPSWKQVDTNVAHMRAGTRIHFGDYTLDIRIAESGHLGIVIAHPPRGMVLKEDMPEVDIVVSPELVVQMMTPAEP